ncbi:hypothetical protein HOR97_gp45 [Agrobacterium phage Atu_ph03]|uniref:Uncharacterized protein n=2 Tax=Atuphduovirus TaxID=2731928 RepID=A0A2L0UYZ8_9CAUD|nr:hypothetical protein HOR96_gp42 [Agrobacterium phage Atu_ph02]YP_009791886.1 hypothetical protein HOR97_gp45 [Agrobacterium phage Atu_ph03]AUZ94751.1 hypothetical protein [Agrobacterium phage Atu_ph02]AUZ94794.1 hypothetical protein [Agrobacterium phage Atu_ph03]
MAWTLPKPWENGYTAVTEYIKGRAYPGNLIRVWKKMQDMPDPRTVYHNGVVVTHNGTPVLGGP